MLEIHACKIGVIDIHLANGFIQLGSIKEVLSLSVGGVTLTACYSSRNSRKNLVTSPFSKIRILRIGPKGENLANTI